MSETEPTSEPQAEPVVAIEESTRSVDTPAAAAATPAASATVADAAPAASAAVAAVTAAPAVVAAAVDATTATIFDNITSAINIMGAPLGISEIIKELKVSMDKILLAAKTPTMLPMVVSAETQRISMLFVKQQVDKVKTFPDVSAKISEILAALAKGDTASLLKSSQSLLSLAPATAATGDAAPAAAAPASDLANVLITNMLTNPALISQIKQINDITDQINTALAGAEIVRYNENMKKLTSTLFPLLAVKQ